MTEKKAAGGPTPDWVPPNYTNLIGPENIQNQMSYLN